MQALRARAVPRLLTANRITPLTRALSRSALPPQPPPSPPPAQPGAKIPGGSAASPSDNTPSQPPSSTKRSLLQDVRDHAANLKAGTAATFDPGLIPRAQAKVFPRIKTTSLSTKRIVIADEAAAKPATLVLVAFRNSADSQLAGWRDALTTHFPGHIHWFDVTVNESFAAQALSGFVQKWQRGKTNPNHHDYYVAFNSKAREPLETLLLSENRLYGNALLLDRAARVRFRAAGPPSEKGTSALAEACKRLIEEDS